MQAATGDDDPTRTVDESESPSPKRAKSSPSEGSAPPSPSSDSSPQASSESSKSYIVFEVYYKHGDYHMTECTSKLSLAHYLWEYIFEHHRSVPRDFDMEEFNDMTLEEKIDTVLDMDDEVRQHSDGFRIANIIEINSECVIYGGVQCSR